MSCVLRARGIDFAVDEFLAESSLKPIAIFRKGQPQWPKVNSAGPKLRASGFHASVSEADFSDIKTQIDDALDFLQQNQTELSRLIALPGIERVWLDFGIEERDVAAQHESFPPNLLSLAGNLGIWIDFTLYPSQKPGVPRTPRAPAH